MTSSIASHPGHVEDQKEGSHLVQEFRSSGGDDGRGKKG